jgi:hypothetical protein
MCTFTELLLKCSNELFFGRELYYSGYSEVHYKKCKKKTINIVIHIQHFGVKYIWVIKSHKIKSILICLDQNSILCHNVPKQNKWNHNALMPYTTATEKHFPWHVACVPKFEYSNTCNEKILRWEDTSVSFHAT